ncbi:MAG: helix-turn-helix transcriptional regulator [Chitinophagaceae bacterium]|nr:helix-turn-helix transcriptional regulator [Chitinophagaceae bacterium]MCW5905226.1 helix-turn-helix transcriptional regulator [Chitinophagaceae bacterium]
METYVINKVKQIRQEKKLSQTDLAFAIGVSTGFIGKIESFKFNSKYNLNHINNISKALDISPKDLLPETSL